MFNKPIWINRPCFFIVKASKKAIGRIGSTADFEGTLKRLNDYIHAPDQRKRSLPARRWDAILAITGFRNLTDAKRFEIYVENMFRLEQPMEEITLYRQFKSEELPKEQPKIWKTWDIYWSTKLDEKLLESLKVGWDIADLRNASEAKMGTGETGNDSEISKVNEGRRKLYTIRHRPFEFDDFIPWNQLLEEWRTLKKEKKQSQSKKELECKEEMNTTVREIREPPIHAPRANNHWFKVVDDSE
ncbi:6126_t:CDS:2 [Acaulospora colombiana]|uniref:6126_t:CDS:1 n=1 Tax=Acaulospora colombiana TaxID=27376 RepID=A0ACA9L0A2_9GLOM|nr:6126_t:CDS:2 [Acaulospora colombiana]